MSDEQNNSELIKQLRIDDHQRVHVKTTSTGGVKGAGIKTKVPIIFFCVLISSVAGFSACYWWLTQYISYEKEPHALSKVSSKVQSSPANFMSTQTDSFSDTEAFTATNTRVDNNQSVDVAKKLPKNKILDASGYVTARQVATVSARVVGLITEVNVEEGMKVEKGQVLALIDDSSVQVALALARTQVEMRLARIDSLKVERAEALRILTRQMELEKAGSFSSQSQLSQAQSIADRLRATIASAEAELKSARLSVQAREIDVDNHVIRAPYSGVVTAKNAQAGEIMSPSAAGGGFTRTGICTIVNMGSLEIEVDVNEAYIGRVSAGQPVVAVLDAYPKLKIPASVIAVIPTADRAKATVRVRIQIQQYDPRILPDMSVKVSFYSGEQ